MLTAYVTSDLYDAIKRRAKSESRSISQVAAMLIEAALREEQNTEKGEK